MPGRHRRSQAQPWTLVVGGALGAVLRFALAQAWPQPKQLLISTTVTVGLAFLVATYLMAVGVTSALHSVAVGVCSGAASLSAYAVLTVSQPPKLSIAFLTLTPAAAIGGLLCGLVAARVVAR
ncbi:chromosome condensation protein CrcB [Mycolicibacterium austroafricanum]|uniref:chromosome condensation protein CrcB n=1 Tax=Mycolicibacterium austroafricanum TaxID=39687 RepID=UPI001CA31910|nr:chromosome condensation protein CrcB [Mycolicibacterium austroafricanum]QZT58447.1 chromosome condensation protein CrcB [Mycolicibacterium austroafricanum]